MKKSIILFAVILFFPVIAQADWVNVFGSGDSRVIYTFHDNGDVTTATANQTARGWMIFDDRGNMTQVNDYSGCSNGDRDRPSGRWGTPDPHHPFVPFE